MNGIAGFGALGPRSGGNHRFQNLRVDLGNGALQTFKQKQKPERSESALSHNAHHKRIKQWTDETDHESFSGDEETSGTEI